MSCLITTPNPMTEVTSPARLAQSLLAIFSGSLAVIVENGRTTFTVFPPLRDLFRSLRDSLRDSSLSAGRDLRAKAMSLSAIRNLPTARRVVQLLAFA
jgi:hypothetical protein